MTLKLVYTNDSKMLYSSIIDMLRNYPSIKLEAFNEDIFKDRKKAYKVKGAFGAKLAPFAVLIDDKPIKAFYSEANTCTIEEISKLL